MFKKLIYTFIILSLMFGLSAAIPVPDITNLIGSNSNPGFLKQEATSGQPCQCVQYIQDALYGSMFNKLNEAGWGTAESLDNPIYWKHVQATLNAETFTKVPSPVVPQDGDVIIMHHNALVYVKSNGSGWDHQSNIGKGAGHIGFVTGSPVYYNGDFQEMGGVGQSGWKISMISANWGGMNYIENSDGSYLTDMSVGNFYGEYHKDGDCNNVNISVLFLPTKNSTGINNPISFWAPQ